jgi:hypothetical protein
MRVLQEGALDAAGFDRAAHLGGEREAAVFLDNAVVMPETGAAAGARVAGALQAASADIEAESSSARNRWLMPSPWRRSAAR